MRAEEAVKVQELARRRAEAEVKRLLAKNDSLKLTHRQTKSQLAA
jgi:hypothetical protein